MITVTGVILSTMVVVLTLASQQYGPRLVKNFIEDRPSQFVIGAFAGCFIYSIITLKNINSGGTEFVPTLSVLFAVVLSLTCIGLMIYFVQHVASAIQVQSIMRRVYHDLNHAVDELFPEEIAPEKPSAKPTADAPRTIGEGAELTCIRSHRAGYVQYVQDDDLMRLAKEWDLGVELKARPGDFVYDGYELASVNSKRALDDDALGELRGIFVMGTFPTHQQDATFPIRQMEEIAIRALSPGINDPHTAVECIDYLTCSFRKLARRTWPKPQRFDAEGALRVIAPPREFETLLRQAFQQIHFYGRQDITIVTRIVASLNIIAEECPSGSERRETIVKLTREVIQESQESLPFASQRERIPDAVSA
ncbi:hypothetical protein GCM10007047_32890 [Cerasicoccus arenae]|uniref:DUF2254 domain-containing protein n=2 Tax=Cerasicoccus arenae TaxID=424488 RepID=A0A8J3DD91_9BACT|nr:hypothetical protein GCM10007047_32890 [Cerasicoccus arenae]